MEEETFIPNLEWFTLREACEAKGLNYHTALNRKELRPNGGIPDGTVGGKRVWRRETIKEWIKLSDADVKTINRSTSEDAKGATNHQEKNF